MDAILKNMNQSYDRLTTLQAQFMTTDAADSKRGCVHVQQNIKSAAGSTSSAKNKKKEKKEPKDSKDKGKKREKDDEDEDEPPPLTRVRRAKSEVESEAPKTSRRSTKKK
eukprot:s396_g23.t1